MSLFYKLSIKEIKRETQDAVSVVFDIPEKLQNEFNFVSGQYITIQTTLDGSLLRRAYSICSSPNSDELRIAIKEVEKGTFSVYANKSLKIGDILEVAAPEGRFILETVQSNKKNYIAFVAGSGITPVMSIIKSVVETEKESKFILVYGNKSDVKTIFKNELDKLVNKYGNQFEVNYVFSQKLDAAAFSGRINFEIVNEILNNKYKHISFDEYFLCGPESMIDLVKETIIKYGINNDSIKFELFSSTSDKKEIESELIGGSKITVLLDDEETTFDMGKDDVILSAVLAQGLDAPYSCQGGICSSCLAKVIEGKAVMDKNSILNNDEVADGLILTCQAHPITDTIKIDYDDV